jgi:hypothetical protein
MEGDVSIDIPWVRGQLGLECPRYADRVHCFMPIYRWARPTQREAVALAGPEGPAGSWPRAVVAKECVCGARVAVEE